MAVDALAPFVPENLPQAMELAKVLAQSSLIPTPLRGKAADVLVVLMKGRELGLSPIHALSEIHVIEGKPVSAATLKVGLCLRSKACEYFRLVESSGAKAVYETKRTGSEPVRLTWTIEQASKAQLTGKKNWQTHPDAMLRARCSSALATAVYPDLVQGLLTDDEAEEIDVTPHAPPHTGGEAKPAEQTPAVTRTESVKDSIRKAVATRTPTPAPSKMQIVDVVPVASTSVAPPLGAVPPEPPPLGDADAPW